ncbi:pantoate--beta-alanine ligase [Metabacillus indicus]|uniref:Pantothenate synthetase n=1 Tax=Metabacillus indicus TaxID=246786 RepID=A0A084H0A3_METID|nr:pantoate--beta-alanine ligase [Metabacillus indicus]KEZ53015.1 pantoate--beta-alanine ligase [Metabacillus indicus]
MKTVTTIKELKQIIKNHKKENRTIGFVPTMGYLHEGHLSLMKKAREENDLLVVSIFVNPLQFGENEDFDSYPRNLERDAILTKEEGADYLFAPSADEMYPHEPSISMKAVKRTNVLCGKSRPGHFDGVAAVLTKLFHLVQPDRAYFGMKDAQQVAVISGLIEDFHFPVELVPVETVREPDGLAKSSRNVYLLKEEREQAPELYKALNEGAGLLASGHSPEHAADFVKKRIEDRTTGEIDYVEVYSYPDLQPLQEAKGTIILAAAVKFSKARLIDNITLQL